MKPHLGYFYDSKFRIYDEDFPPNRTKRLLSGDGWAIFEVMLHWGASMCVRRKTQGVRFRVQRLWVMKDGSGYSVSLGYSYLQCKLRFQER